jgi:hypothetical protein
MDLRLFWGVCRRYKRLAIGGSLAAIVLGVLAYGTPGFSGGMPTLVARGQSTYQSAAQLLITRGAGTYSTIDSQTISSGAPGYLSSLSPIYAGLANGSAVQDAVRASHIPGTVTGAEGIDQLTGDYTPFIDMTATAPTRSDAAALIRLGISALQRYVGAQESASGVPQSERVQLEVVKSGLPPVLASRPKPTIPILVFLAVLAATIALMFSLENRDPQTAARLGRVPVASRTIAAEGTVLQPAALEEHALGKNGSSTAAAGSASSATWRRGA